MDDPQRPRGNVPVTFARGHDRMVRLPRRLARLELGERFAVIQQTAVDGCDDMVFDEELWLTLVRFLMTSRLGARLVVTTETNRQLGWDEFFATWYDTPSDDRDPPPLIVVEAGGETRLAMMTEYWTRVGGPAPYADSYTYAIFSERPIEDDVRRWLLAANTKGRWELVSETWACGR